MRLNKKKLQAIALIELVLSMMIISIALTKVVLVFYQISIDSPAVIEQQAIYIANGYLSEILSKNFPPSVPCLPPPPSRANYTTVCDYRNMVNIGARDNQNNAILGLENFTINITLDTTTANLGGLASGSKVIRIDVKVTNAKLLKGQVLLSGYKGKY